MGRSLDEIKEDFQEIKDGDVPTLPSLQVELLMMLVEGKEGGDGDIHPEVDRIGISGGGSGTGGKSKGGNTAGD